MSLEMIGFFVVVVVVSMINSIFQMLTLCSWGRLHLAVIYYPSNILLDWCSGFLYLYS